MDSKPLPSLEELRARFRYEPYDGLLYNLQSRPGVKRGSVAGSVHASQRSVRVTIDRTTHLAHRIAWKLMTGQDPDGLVIDHIDHNPSNNKWHNLRLVTQSENLKNRRSYTWKKFH